MAIRNGRLTIFMDINEYCFDLTQWILDVRLNNNDHEDHSNHCTSANNRNQIMNLQSDGSYCQERKNFSSLCALFEWIIVCRHKYVVISLEDLILLST